ncbi:hypothetical protein ACO0LF_27530 [Undibacterium sp. Di27W]
MKLHGDTVTAMAAACALAKSGPGKKTRSEEAKHDSHGDKDHLSTDHLLKHDHHTHLWCSHLHC